MMMATAILMVIPITKTNTVKGTMTPMTMAMATTINSMCLPSPEQKDMLTGVQWILPD